MNGRVEEGEEEAGEEGEKQEEDVDEKKYEDNEVGDGVLELEKSERSEGPNKSQSRLPFLLKTVFSSLIFFKISSPY